MHMVQIWSEKSESKHSLFVHALTVNNLYWRHIKISGISDTAKSKVDKSNKDKIMTSIPHCKLRIQRTIVSKYPKDTGRSGFYMELKEMGKNGIHFSF